MKRIITTAPGLRCLLLVPVIAFGLAACKNDSSNSDNTSTALMVPAYPSLELESVANTTWSSCVLEKNTGQYLFTILRFGDNSLEIESNWHASTDTDCSAASTASNGRVDYTPAEDNGIATAPGWRNSDGSETDNGDAPQSADGLGLLPGQPSVRRARFIYEASYGIVTVPVAALKQVLFLDVSGAGPRLYTGSPLGTADADGFPAYLNNFGVYTPYTE